MNEDIYLSIISEYVFEPMNQTMREELTRRLDSMSGGSSTVVFYTDKNAMRVEVVDRYYDFYFG